MDIQHPDITNAMTTGYDRQTWRDMQQNKEDHDCDRDAADDWED